MAKYIERDRPAAKAPKDGRDDNHPCTAPDEIFSCNQEDGTTRGAIPPYVPFPSLKSFVQNTRQQGLANRIDRSVLTNFSGSTQTQLITALRFLGLIDAKGHPTDRLETLVKASGTDEWPNALAAALRDRYPTLFGEFDLARATPNQFGERFRGTFPGSDAVQRKAVTFF